jgi:hypothetical protein
MATNLPDKRAILQAILDSIESGWSIYKPPPNDPTELDELCIFHHEATHRKAEVEINNSLFQDPGRRAELLGFVRAAIRDAKPHS